MSEINVFDRIYSDPIVAEIHETRRKILARFGNDIDAYMTFVANRRIPGAKYVNIGDNAQLKSAHPSFKYPSVPDSTSILCAGEGSPAEYNAKAQTPQGLQT